MSIPRQIIIDLVEGDDAPDLVVRFDGLDLRSYSSIKMKIERDDGTRFSRTLDADPDDYELATLSWLAGDLLAGRWLAEFELVQVYDGKRFTLPTKYPMVLNIRRDFG
jgi:hypothetical protein